MVKLFVPLFNKIAYLRNTDQLARFSPRALIAPFVRYYLLVTMNVRIPILSTETFMKTRSEFWLPTLWETQWWIYSLVECNASLFRKAGNDLPRFTGTMDWELGWGGVWQNVQNLRYRERTGAKISQSPIHGNVTNRDQATEYAFLT